MSNIADLSSDALIGRSFIGNIIQVVSGTYATNADLTTTIPLDDTIPQNTEGTQIISVAIVPKLANSTLLAFWVVYCAGPLSEVIISAIFLNSTANAQAVADVQDLAAAGRTTMSGISLWSPGSTASQTVSLRVGGYSSTVRCNGTLTAREFGGAMKCILVVAEVAA